MGCFVLINGNVGKVGGVSEESVEESEESYGTTPGSEERRPANMPLVKLGGLELQLLPEYSARRCDSKGRGSLYDPVYGICCHFCRFSLCPYSLCISIIHFNFCIMGHR